MRRASVEKGIGCAAVIPAALIGFAGLTDGIGPKGWFGFSELIGWAVLCAAASFALALILSRVRWSRIVTYVAFPIAAALAAGFAVLMNWLGLDAPMTAKHAFTSSLQVIGTVVPVSFAAWLVYLIWTALKADVNRQG